MRIQTVLFHSDLAQLWRLLRGISAASRQALDNGLVGRVEWAIGDSSPLALLGEEDVRNISAAAPDVISRTEYDHFDVNLGSSGGQNRLATKRPCDLLFILNPDTYPSPSAIVELINALDRPEVGIVEAKQIPLEHPRHYDLLTGETSWASGCCMMVTRSLFDQLNGFDHEHFLLHCDDVDFSWRARLLGFKVLSVPHSVVFHDKRPRFGDGWPAPDIELYHAALGRLMLASRFDRPDIARETTKAIEKGDCKPQHEALAEFKQRASLGRIPKPMKNAGSVAEFIEGEYARHRF